MSLTNVPKSRLFMILGSENTPKSNLVLYPSGNCVFLLFARLTARSHRGLKCALLLWLLQFCCGLLRIPFFLRNSLMGAGYEPRELAKIAYFHGFGI